MAVKFYLRKPDKQGYFSIQMFQTVNGVNLTHPTKIKILDFEWDKENQRAKRDKVANAKLAKFTLAGMDFENSFGADEIPTQQQFTDFINARFGITPKQPKAANAKTSKPTAVSFFDIVDDFLSTCRQRTNANGELVTERTYLKYVYTRNSLVEFEKFIGRKLTVDGFNDTMLEQYQSFVTVQMNRANNTVRKYAKCLLVILKHAEKAGANINADYKKFHPTKSNKTENVVLNETELKQLWEYQPENPYLENTKRLFIIGCYTGLRFSDYSRLSSANVDKQRRIITIHQQKTSNPVQIPIHPDLMNYLDGINWEMPHAITNQKFNKYVKQLCKEIGMNTTVEIKKIVGGKRIITTHEKWELVGSHTARRTFATNMYKQGFPTTVIMSLTGHHSLADFLRYIVIDNSENINIVQTLWDKQYNKAL